MGLIIDNTDVGFSKQYNQIILMMGLIIDNIFAPTQK